MEFIWKQSIHGHISNDEAFDDGREEDVVEYEYGPDIIFLLLPFMLRLKILGGNIWLDWQKIYYLSHLMSLHSSTLNSETSQFF
ncbi:hypothetical protein HanHA300_Chr13g0468301 [Helianthus annuus]|nr:hypothetical protein HanHA300_Chr13g0468301 [Helianthus annuus]KAJ0496461.1 hypothetical protein HanHA89_Chr13g0500041 [Helianthus annuus]KAJ0662518.1 hypothetical protein HanLR1_Chr13g0470451 [Helianthus annuus]